MNILPTDERQRIYDELERLKQAKPSMGASEAMQELGSKFPKLPSKATIQSWMNGRSKPSTSVQMFHAMPSEELSFFLAAWLGDGWADDADGGKRLHLQVRSREFAEEFAVAANKILHKAERQYFARQVVRKDGIWFHVKVTSKRLFEFAMRPLSELVPILEINPAGFLRGFATAEGNPSVSVQRGNPDFLALTICFSNTDFEFLQCVKSFAEKMNLHSTSITRGDRPGLSRLIRGRRLVTANTEWQFRLAKLESISRFVKEVGFADSRKQNKAQDALSMIRELGPRNAATKWKESYRKVGGVWLKRELSSTLAIDA